MTRREYNYKIYTRTRVMSIPFVTNGGLLRIALRKNILSLMENGSFCAQSHTFATPRYGLYGHFD